MTELHNIQLQLEVLNEIGARDHNGKLHPAPLKVNYLKKIEELTRKLEKYELNPGDLVPGFVTEES